MKPGTVVIVPTGQSGTVCDGSSVILTNGDIWTGDLDHCYEPKSQEELDAAPLEVEKFNHKEKPKKKGKKVRWEEDPEFQD